MAALVHLACTTGGMWSHMYRASSVFWTLHGHFLQHIAFCDSITISINAMHGLSVKLCADEDKLIELLNVSALSQGFSCKGVGLVIIISQVFLFLCH